MGMVQWKGGYATGNGGVQEGLAGGQRRGKGIVEIDGMGAAPSSSAHSCAAISMNASHA